MQKNHFKGRRRNKPAQKRWLGKQINQGRQFDVLPESCSPPRGTSLPEQDTEARLGKRFLRAVQQRAPAETLLSDRQGSWRGIFSLLMMLRYAGAGGCPPRASLGMIPQPPVRNGFQDVETGSWKFLLNANGNSQLELNSRNFFGKWGEKAGEEAGAFSTLALKPP